MKNIVLAIVAFFICLSRVGSGATLQQQQQQQQQQLRDIGLQGSVKFDVTTNVEVISFQGEVEEGSESKVQAHIKESKSAGEGGRVIEKMTAVFPVAALKTGLSKRDQHMREKVFKTGHIRFVAQAVNCPLKKERAKCQVSGKLSINDKEEWQTLQLEVTSLGPPLAFKGKATIDIAKFGIEPPSFMGVTVKNNVLITFEMRETLSL